MKSRARYGFLVAVGLLLAAHTACVAQAVCVIVRPTQVSVGGQTVTLAVGQTVTLMGTRGGEATVRVTLANGAVALVQVPANAIASAPTAAPAPPKPSRTLTVASPKPTPTLTPVQPAAVAAPPPSAPTSREVEARLGWRHLRLKELPVPPKKPEFLDYSFTPNEERFEVYIPKSYRADRPCGLLGWISPGDEFATPRKFAPLFDEFRLIALSADRCGNKQDTGRRVGLLVCAALQLAKSLAIDPQRRLLSGFSGGGRVSAIGCFVHPEFWCGAVSWCGGMFYKDYPVLDKANAFSSGINHYYPDGVTPAMAAEARKNVKVVLITGPKDMNYANSKDIERALKQDKFRVLLIDEPGLGHQIGSGQSMRKGLEFVLGPPPMF